jgi:hypothetical protein
MLSWTATLERLEGTEWVPADSYDNGPGGEFFESDFNFPTDPPANPTDGLWQTGLPDGEYRAVLHMEADDGFTFSEWDLIVPGIIMPCSPPTAVTLASFDASAASTAIVLDWETAAELDTLGFNVYRAESADGLRTLLNSSLIAGQAPGSTLGASYQFVDDTASAGITYYYWLQEVGTNLETLEHGPVSAQLEFLGRIQLARPRLRPSRGAVLVSY